MDNIIVFEKNVSTYYFYSVILVKFYKMYKLGIQEIPILDMRNTEYILPSAVPVVLAFGDYLNRLYKKPIKIFITRGSELHNFIIMSKFYEISQGLEIFCWEEDFLNGWNYKELRDLHKVSYTNVIYPDVEKIKNPIQKRNYVYDCILDKTKVVYAMILKDTDHLPEKVIDATIKAIAEIETNAIIYSKSHSFTYVASDQFGTNISIADSGMGFERSFQSEGRKLKLMDLFPDYDKKFQKFFIIMSVMNYSLEKHLEDDREDLWTLKTNIVNNNGVFKIQYENTQVIFSANRCKNCVKSKNVSECVKCLLNDYSHEAYSPIKLFNIGFQGVRIEITVNRGE